MTGNREISGNSDIRNCGTPYEHFLLIRYLKNKKLVAGFIIGMVNID